MFKHILLGSPLRPMTWRLNFPDLVSNSKTIHSLIPSSSAVAVGTSLEPVVQSTLNIGELQVFSA